jgi:uncharacterized protein with GYD domain
MPTFVSLTNWTDQGIKTFRDSVRRSEDYRAMVDQSGGRVRELLWTLGEYDIVAVVDTPDDETMAALNLQLLSRGNVRSRIMKAFNAEEMNAIIGRTG